MAPYAPGEHPVRYADIFPATVTPKPEGVPDSRKLRVIVTERFLTVLWQSGSGSGGPLVGRVDIEVDPESVSGDYRGGQVGEYTYAKAGGCGCGATALKGWKAFPGISFTEAPRTPTARTFGVPPQTRFSRTRS